MIREKLSPIERALVAAASLPAHKARQVLMLICQSGMTTQQDVPQPTEGQKHFAKREKFIARMQAAQDRVLNYAKTETLRNCERHFRKQSNNGMKSAQGEPSTLAEQLTFDRQLFAEELLTALRDESDAALTAAGQQLFDEVGRADPFKLPPKQAIKFLDTRTKLLADVPDEVHGQITQAIQDGLESGESKQQLIERIEAAFGEISRTRADTIANTETAAAFNYAREKAMRKAGVTHKKWLHSMSPLIKEPRPTHVEADGQIRPIDEPFDIGGVPMLRPGDESAGPEEIINCHCVAIPVEAPIESAGEREGHPFRGNQYVEGLRELGVEEIDLPRNNDLNQMAVEAVRKAKEHGFEVPKSITSHDYGRRAIAYGSSSGIGLTKSRIHTADLLRQVEIGHLSQPNVVLHEIGHIEHGKTAGSLFDHYSTWSYPEVAKPIALKVSKYAATNPKEFIAETFAGHLSGKRYPEDVMSLYDRHHGPKLKP